MIKTAQAIVQETAEASSWAYERITEIGRTADGWILCTTESGKSLLKEPVSGELIDPTA